MNKFTLAPCVSLACICLFSLAGCSESPNDGMIPSAGGTSGSGGLSAASGGASVGGTGPSGGSSQSGGTGGASFSGGASSGGSHSTGGSLSSGGAPSGGASSDGGTNSGGASSGGGTGGSSEGPTLPPVTDYSEPGPFETVVETSKGPGNGYTIVRPVTLGEDGFLHAPIIFGPGIGQGVNVHTTMLRNFASHGFIVVGTPVLSGGPGDAGNRQKMQDGLDWIVAQHSTAGIYEGNVWIDHAVSMGFSVGGTAAVEIGGDEAVITIVSIHGHSASAELHGTMLQTTGTGDTVGMPLQQQTYDASEVPTFLATLTGANHGYIEQNGGGEERPAIVAWMRYWVYGDLGAEDFFFGNDCRLCKSPWENPKRKNWD